MSAGSLKRLAAAGIIVAAIVAGVWMLAGESSPNVVLLTMDTTRADGLGVYGFVRAETPAIDALAAERVLYEHCYSPVPVTLPSHSSIMTGLFPPRHGVRVNGWDALVSEAETLAESLKREGYQTAAYVGAFVLDSQFGLDQAFDVYNDETTPASKERRFCCAERNAELVTDAALAWWKDKSGDPAFLWVHYFDPHSPYEPPGYDPALAFRTGYDSEIHFVDQHLSRLLDEVRKEDAIIVLTADHGEALSEHGEPTHGLFVYDATLRVSLIVRFPDLRSAGRRVAGPVSPVGILPSVADWVGFRAPEDLDGRPLPIDEEPEARPIYFENHLTAERFGWSHLEGVREGDWKYIRAPRPELYDLASDRFEEKNLYDSGGENGERLAALHTELVEGFERRGRLASKDVRPTEEALAKLRGLGCLVGRSSGEGSSNGKDPKDMVKVFIGVQLAINQITHEKPDEAAETLPEIVTRDDPTNGRAIEILASLASQPLKARTRIIAAVQDALERPIDAHSLAHGLEGLAAAFIQGNRCQPARRFPTGMKASATPPRPYADSTTWRGVSNQEALDVLERLLEIVPAEARHNAHLGNAYAGLKRHKEAIAAYEFALAGIDQDTEPPEWAKYVTEQLTELRSGAKSQH